MAQSTIGSAADRDAATTSIRKIALASSIGATIEWYDFFLYGVVAALVFNKLFSRARSARGTLLAYTTFRSASSRDRSAASSSVTMATASAARPFWS